MDDSNSLSKAERLTGFQRKVIHHPALTEAYSKLDMVVKSPAGLSLCMAFGPTGVGKTTLIHKLEERLCEHFRPQMESDPGMIPVCRVEAPAPDSGRFHWRDMWIRMLESMHEPQITRKQPRDADGKTMILSGKSRSVRQNVKGISGPDVRRELECCFKHRQTRVIIIDEAQHLKKAPNARQMLDSMDAIKSLASISNIFLVLVGTYELLDMLTLSGQLARRTYNVHFPRYRGDDSEQLRAFKSVVCTFQKALPFSDPSDLVSNYEYLYQGSFGCVGILKNWLDRAVSQAIDSDKKTLPFSILKQAALDQFALTKIAKELHEADRHQIWNRKTNAECDAGLAAVPNAHNGHTVKNGNLKPGERKARRDKTGSESPNDNLSTD